MRAGQRQKNLLRASYAKKSLLDLAQLVVPFKNFSHIALSSNTPASRAIAPYIARVSARYEQYEYVYDVHANYTKIDCFVLGGMHGPLYI